jgi:hypothetical protein
MFRRHFLLGYLLPAAILSGSVGVDIYSFILAKMHDPLMVSLKPAFPKPGPRRYPPGYRAALGSLR